jgi:diguanylate cyclase (GGDEF)-like protein/PAS domain S-box-containing protein
MMNFNLLKKILALPLRLNSLSAAADKSEIYDAYLAERQARISLERVLEEKDASVERLLREHSRELTDANTQLSQQIALRKQISDALVKSQTRLNQAMSATRLGLIDWDILHGQFYQSEFLHVFGDKEQSSEDLIKTLKRVIHPADYVHVRDTLNACLDGRLSEYIVHYRVQDEGQGWIWLEECGKVVDVDAKGKALRILGTRRNIHSEVIRDEQVRLAKSVVDHTSEGVFVLDPQTRFLSVNPAFAAIIGYQPAYLNGKRIQDISDTPQREEIYREIFQQVQARDQWQGELLEKRFQGDYYPQWTQINAIRDEHGQIKYYAGMVSDLSFRKAADKKLDYLLNYDDLTKLANRVQFRDQLHRALVRYKDDGVPFALVVLDIDRFKQFNDSFGHEAADHLLCDIARRLSKNIQKVDILARVGSNEFACVVSCSPTFNVMKFARRLFETVTRNHYEVAGQGVALSCSVGIAKVPEHTENIEILMQFAALAVQKAKFQGGDQIVMFDDSLKSFSREKVEMEHALRVALETGQLEVFYQPKLDLKTGRIHAVESLVRWNHPEKGLVSPADFVNIAEESALITDLGRFVLKTACEQTRSWDKKGLGKVSVAVNLSIRQLREAGLKQMIAGIIEQTGVPAECLELELTESMIMEDANATVRCLQALKSLGLKISVDDFGTGYSSLSYLKDFPVDTLKIDKSFVDGMEESQAQLAIVKAIIVLGHSLNLKVVAEGVENHPQLKLLMENECDAVQGYLVSKPLCAAEMLGLLEEQAETGACSSLSTPENPC